MDNTKIKETYNNHVVPCDAFDLAQERFIQRYGRLIEPIYSTDNDIKQGSSLEKKSKSNEK